MTKIQSALVLLLIFCAKTINGQGAENVVSDKMLKLNGKRFVIENGRYGFKTVEECIANDTVFTNLSGTLFKPNEACWIKFEIDNRINEPLVIVFPLTVDVILYEKGNKDSLVLKHYHLPWEKNIFTNKAAVYLPTFNGSKTFYAKLYSELPVGTGFYIYPSIYFNKLEFKDHLFLGFLVGTYFFVSLLYVVLVFLFKNKMLIFGFLFTTFITLLNQYTNALLYRLFPVFISGIFNEVFIYSAATISILLFAYEFIKGDFKDLIFVKIYLWMAIIVKVVTVSIGIFTKNISFHSPWIDFFMLTPMVWLSFRNRNLFYGFLIIYLGYFYRSITFKNFFLHDLLTFQNTIPDLQTYFTGLLEIVALIFVSVNRYKSLLLEKNKITLQKLDIQTALVASQAENLKLQESLNSQLEIKVAEKTEELHLAYEKILKMNEQLHEDNSQLQKNLEFISKSKVLDPSVDYLGFCQLFSSDEICMRFLADLKWKNGFECKKCGYKKYYLIEEIPHARKCRICKTKESPMQNTLFEQVRFDLPKALYMVFHIYHHKNTNLNQLSEEMSLRRATLTSFNKKITDKMKHVKNAKSWVDIIAS